MNKIKIGLVGAGGIAQTIHLPNLKKNEHVAIAAISDNDEIKAFRVAEKFKIKSVYEDAAEMLEREKLDGLLLMTPTNLHLPICSIAAQKGIHLFLEKPPVLNLAEMKKLLAVVKKNNIHAMVGNNLIFDPNLNIFKEMVQKSEIGEILYTNIGWLQALKASSKSSWMFKKNIAGGGVVMDLGVVLIELMLWLTDKRELISVKANTNNIRLKKEVEDFASIYLTFKNGMTAIIEMSWDAIYPDNKFFLKFYGTKGYASYPKLRLFKEFRGHLLNSSPEGKLSSKNSLKQSYLLEMEHFINIMLNKCKPKNLLQEYIYVYQIIEACYQSANDGREVFIENL